jgi:hypothetical protein
MEFMCFGALCRGPAKPETERPRLRDPNPGMRDSFDRSRTMEDIDASHVDPSEYIALG